MSPRGVVMLVGAPVVSCKYVTVWFRIQSVCTFRNVECSRSPMRCICSLYQVVFIHLFLPLV
jgi:hypothetical protein